MSIESADDRRSARANVLLRAIVESEGARFPMKVGNLSAHGALVLGNAPLHEGEPMIFRANGMAVEGWVAWACAGSSCAGIQFGKPVEPRQFVQKAAAHTAIIRDSRDLDFKRPGFKGDQLTAAERQVVDEWHRGKFGPTQGYDTSRKP